MMGIAFSLPAGGDPAIGGIYYLDPNSAIRANLGFGLGFASGTYNFSLEVGYRVYFARYDSLLLFGQPALFIGNPNNTFTLALEGAVGGEFFVNSHIAFGVATGLAFQLQVPPAAGSAVTVNLNTGTTAIFGELFW